MKRILNFFDLEMMCLLSFILMDLYIVFSPLSGCEVTFNRLGASHIPYQSIGTHQVELPHAPPEPQSMQECIAMYVDDICQRYEAIDPAIVKAVIWQESRFDPTCVGDGGYSIGLMQVSTKWHLDRAYSLGVTDLSDPYGNILVGVDYLNDLLEHNGDLGLALMLYNMNHNDAYRLYRSGKLSSYAKSVLSKAEEYREGGG